MALTKKTYTLSHTIGTKEVAANQAIVISVDLSDIVNDSLSTLFMIDTISLNAYKKDTCEPVPIKYAALNASMTRNITHDVFKLSSRWTIDGSDLREIQIAGTDLMPYNRTLCIHDKHARVTMLNLLGFAMTSGLWGIRNVKYNLDVILESKITEFTYNCIKCESLVATVVDDKTEINTLFRFPLCCEDGQLCTPAPPSSKDHNNRLYNAIYCMISALSSLGNNTIPGLDQITNMWAPHLVPKYCNDCNKFPPRSPYFVVVPQDLLRRFAGLYDTMCLGMDSFAVVDIKAPCIKIIVESPSSDIGLLTGGLSITMIYGHSLASIHAGVAQATSGLEEDEESSSTAADVSHIDITQMSNDVILKSIPGVFRPTICVSLMEWCVHQHNRYDDTIV